ncbi:MAG TPA: hypothetical protein VGC76_01690 [Pyrinomonadaceae bacterium]|jgi:hypothetical protein
MKIYFHPCKNFVKKTDNKSSYALLRVLTNKKKEIRLDITVKFISFWAAKIFEKAEFLKVRED